MNNRLKEELLKLDKINISNPRLVQILLIDPNYKERYILFDGYRRQIELTSHLEYHLHLTLNKNKMEFLLEIELLFSRYNIDIECIA